MNTRCTRLAGSGLLAGLMLLAGCSTSGSTPACTEPNLSDCYQWSEAGLPDAGSDGDSAANSEADVAAEAHPEAQVEASPEAQGEAPAETGPSNDGPAETSTSEGGQDDGSSPDVLVE